MEAGLVDLVVEATSILDEVAVEVDPRVSFTCAAWKRDTVVLSGIGFAGVGVSDGDSARFCSGLGVGGGDMKATFFCTSVWAALPPLLLFVLRELRPAESLSTRDGADDTVISNGGAASWFTSAAGNGTIEPVGVGLTEDDSVDEEVGSSTGGSGRVEISGNGL